ncbi:hypothetical protein [Sphingobacterium sp. BIGb0165]|nr:hypothetical protein [Sphingobacterium sp. BIGb0165]MCS4226393.1 hypothetical protein [Sphingobacterium sp. BIGb0165]
MHKAHCLGAPYHPLWTSSLTVASQQTTGRKADQRTQGRGEDSL